MSNREISNTNVSVNIKVIPSGKYPHVRLSVSLSVCLAVCLARSVCPLFHLFVFVLFKFLKEGRNQRKTNKMAKVDRKEGQKEGSGGGKVSKII